MPLKDVIEASSDDESDDDGIDDGPGTGADLLISLATGPRC